MKYQMSTMARIICLLFFTISSFIYSIDGLAQKSNSKFPAFRIALTDSTYYSSSKLKKAAVLFVYFKPDCDECKAFTTEMLAKIKVLKNVQIVMITNAALSQVNDFERTFNIKKYPIILGTEGFTMLFLRQFNIQQFPFVMLYNKSGKLINQYTGTVKNGYFNALEKDVKSLQ